MTPFAATLVVLNNYVHDVATSLLLISALWLGWSARDLGARPAAPHLAAFHRSYRRCVRFLVGSVIVIVATGVVRTVHFMELEWFPALGRGLRPILIFKHVVIGGTLVAGVVAWVRLRSRLRAIPGWPDAGERL